VVSSTDQIQQVDGLFIGGISIDLGYLTERQLEEAFQIRKKVLKMGLSETVAEICLKKNYLTAGQVEEVEGILADRAVDGDDLLIAREVVLRGLVPVTILRMVLKLQRIEGGRRPISCMLVALGLLSVQEKDGLKLASRKESKSVEGDRIPRFVGNYEILSEISRGGMGVIYRAKQRSLDRVVALKTLSTQWTSNEEFVERFRREAKAISSINQANIVQVYDVGKVKDFYYIALEYIDGESLESILQSRGTLAPTEALLICDSVARALQHANQVGLIHRDVKPSNILIARTGEVKLTDFGLVKIVTDEAGLTHDGAIMGSPHYISPEQARGKEIDFRTDMYSLGVTLFRAVTGVVPFDAPGAIQVISKHLNLALPSRDTLPNEIPVPVYRLISWWMAKDPRTRPGSWAELIESVQKVLRRLVGNCCPSCRSEVKEGDLICTECGYALESEATSTDESGTRTIRGNRVRSRGRSGVRRSPRSRRRRKKNS
jgi:serine/threonine protein kinase